MHLSKDIPENYIAFERDSNQWIVCEPTKPRKQKKNSKQKINFNEWRKPEETIDQRMNGFSDDKPKIKQQQKLILDREFEVRRHSARSENDHRYKLCFCFGVSDRGLTTPFGGDDDDYAAQWTSFCCFIVSFPMFTFVLWHTHTHSHSIRIDVIRSEDSKEVEEWNEKKNWLKLV